MLIYEDATEEFTDRFIEKAHSYMLGDLLKEKTTMRPLTSREQFETVSEYIETGNKEATLLCGGNRPNDSALAEGCYVKPTIFDNVENNMTTSQKENRWASADNFHLFVI